MQDMHVSMNPGLQLLPENCNALAMHQVYVERTASPTPWPARQSLVIAYGQAGKITQRILAWSWTPQIQPGDILCIERVNVGRSWYTC